MRTVSIVAGALLALALGATARAETVVEYYNATLDHYFITPLANEIAALDNGTIVGWMRTGYTFDGAASPGPGLSPVCRFYIPPAHGDSHFLSASPAECAAVLAKIPVDPNFGGYIEETPAEFYIALPDTASGACPSGTSPVYRLWNGRADSNHRYTPDAGVRDAMLARGYIAEGYGPQGVAMCTTRAAIGDSQVRVTGLSPFIAGCDRTPPTATLFVNAEVEPQIAIDPRDPSHLIGVWQQDRWSDGGARGNRTGYSFDGGLTWTLTQAPLSRCTGGIAGFGMMGADFARASDPWITIGPDGIAYQSAIAFNGDTFAAGSSSAIVVSRSADGGRNWDTANSLIMDGSAFFNDKDSITADPIAPGTAYATWDRLDPTNHGPSYFARTTDGGMSWEAARPIYDPGGINQTINNQIVVSISASGEATLLDMFTVIDAGQNGLFTDKLVLVRSPDRGISWSAPIVVSDIRSIGAYDPQNPANTLRDATNLGSFATGQNGVVVAVWQDARFAGDTYDGIAFSRSLDGGLTWSAPSQVNAVPSVQAFLPAVSIRPDGTIGVLYYDMRNDTPDPSTLLVDVWLVTSTDGVTWTERHVAGPFDFDRAPIAEGGLFVGDYQALASAAGEFVGFYAQTNADPNNRTDIFASDFRSLGAQAAKSVYRTRTVTTSPVTPTLQAKIDRSIRSTLRRRLIGPLAPPRR
ncbi:MAG TPA: sialidase family protein [Casimicrobiaceae bacterium]|nr:sialidase family protein [Casimicrobiaceae bacterium]